MRNKHLVVILSAIAFLAALLSIGVRAQEPSPPPIIDVSSGGVGTPPSCSLDPGFILPARTEVIDPHFVPPPLATAGPPIDPDFILPPPTLCGSAPQRPAAIIDRSP